ncbi:hypothetical protein [Listeria monocytogenes]|uniref:hypothetical protein n=1 Tax=Listeria monocytogenes TaxID=1639 RepID=UPI001357394B|nr:hypothetical protein [Listeria monocytogenes]
MQGTNVNMKRLSIALVATDNKHGSLEVMKNYHETLGVVRKSEFMHHQWKKYQRSFDFDYAKN